MTMDTTDATWREDALCIQTDPEIFFPEKGGTSKSAKKICQECEVRTQCLDYALDNDEKFGIWGGLSTKQRDRVKNGLPSRPLTRNQVKKQQRDAAIIEMAEHQIEAATIAAELHVTDRTVHRVIAAHRDRQELPSAV